jgi:hypothetical protein
LDYKFDSNKSIYTLRRNGNFFSSGMEISKLSPDGTLIWNYNRPCVEDTCYSPNNLEVINDSCIFVTYEKGYEFKEYFDTDVFYTAPSKRENLLLAINNDGKILWEWNYQKVDSSLTDNFYNKNNSAYFIGDSIVKIDPNKTITTYSLTVENDENKEFMFNDSSLMISTEYWGYRVVLRNENFQTVWNKTYQFTQDDFYLREKVKSKFLDKNGNLYLTGVQYEKVNDKYNSNILTMKIDKMGNLVWRNNYDFGPNFTDIGTSITVKDEIVYIGGYSGDKESWEFYDFLVYQIDGNSGNKLKEFRTKGPEIDLDILVGNVKSEIHLFGDNEIAFLGICKYYDYFDLKTFLISDKKYSWILNATKVDDTNCKIYPNPIVNNVLSIANNEFSSYLVTTLSGEVVSQGSLNIEYSNESISLPKMSEGIYLIKLMSNEKSLTHKFMIK